MRDISQAAATVLKEQVLAVVALPRVRRGEDDGDVRGLQWRAYV